MWFPRGIGLVPTLPRPRRYWRCVEQVLNADFDTMRRHATPSGCATDGQQVGQSPGGRRGLGRAIVYTQPLFLAQSDT